QREPAVADGAREGLGLCALVEGQRLVAAGKPTEAEDWFRRATAPGAPAVVVRGAFLGLGDVKLAQGDVAGALESYQQVLSGGMPPWTADPAGPGSRGGAGPRAGTVSSRRLRQGPRLPPAPELRARPHRAPVGRGEVRPRGVLVPDGRSGPGGARLPPGRRSV